MSGAAPPPAGALLARHLSVGVLTSLALAIADVSVGGARPAGGAVSSMSWADRLLAFSNTAGMLAPIGLVVGVALAGALFVFQRTPWFDALRESHQSVSVLFRRAPEAFSSALAWSVAALLYVYGVAAGMRHFSTRYHDPQLASWAMSGFALVLLLILLLFASTLRLIMVPVARRFVGPLASVGTVAVAVSAGVAAGLVGLAFRAPMLLRAYDPVMLAFGPGAVCFYGLLALLSRRVLRAPKRAGVTAALLTALALVLVAWTGATYGGRNRVRALVEQQSVVGRPLLRVYLGLTDMDGDGHAFAFGGGDCDDANPNVHPGAMDEPGDGIDADCFDGDGSREVADFGDGHFVDRPPQMPVRPNFLLISIDALRPDHLGCFGYERPTSPHIDEFCQQAVRFHRVVAQSSRSIRSIPAVFTGRYPSQIAYGAEYLWPSLLRENSTFAEVLRGGGYHTAVTMGTDYFARVDGFFQGFEDTNQLRVYRPPREQPVDEALRQLTRLQNDTRPWALWVHLFNVHERYLWDRTPSRFGEGLEAEYDTEIRLADEQVQRLLDALIERNLADETVVVLFSDHGEAFNEHGHTGHSQALYNEEVLATLMIRTPHIAPRDVRGPVALFDVMPTLLNLADVPLPEPTPARSLLGPMLGAPADPERLIFTELMPDGLYPYDQKAIFRGDRKLIYWTREGTYQLFDLATDPNEEHDLSDDNQEEALEMLGLLRAWMAQTHRPENRTSDILADARLSAEPVQMTQRLDAQYPGLFTVLGFDLPETEFRPGERIAIDFYYRVDSRTERDLFFYVNIEGPAGFPIPAHFHAHHYPVHGRYRTPDWSPGEIIHDPVQMVIPRDIRHPVELRITLTVLEAQRPLEFSSAHERGTTMEIGRVQIR